MHRLQQKSITEQKFTYIYSLVLVGTNFFKVLVTASKSSVSLESLLLFIALVQCIPASRICLSQSNEVRLVFIVNLSNHALFAYYMVLYTSLLKKHTNKIKSSLCWSLGIKIHTHGQREQKLFWQNRKILNNFHFFSSNGRSIINLKRFNFKLKKKIQFKGHERFC